MALIAKACSLEFTAKDNPVAGNRAAWALFYLKDEAALLNIADRLEGRPAGALAQHYAGVIHQKRGRSRPARRRFLMALDMHQEARKPALAALDAIRIADLAWKDSDLRSGLAYAYQALELANQAKDASTQVKAQLKIFQLQYDSGNISSAKQSLRAGAKLVSESDSENRARFLTNEGILAFAQQRPQMARRLHEQAVQKAVGSQDRALQRAVHLNLSQACLRLLDLNCAQSNVDQARKYLEQAGTESAAIIYHEGLVALQAGRFDQAVKLMESVDSKTVPPDLAWSLLHAVGRAREGLGERKAAARAYLHSIAIVEQLRQNMRLSELKYWLLQKKRQPFESLFVMRAVDQHANDALEVVERVKAREILDRLLQRISEDKPAQSKELVRRYDALKAVQDRLIPGMFGKPTRIERVLSAFGDRLAFVYFIARDRMWLLRVQRGLVDLRPLNASLEEIQRSINHIRARPDDAPAARWLGRKLLPVDMLPTQSGALVYLVTDGMLSGLPFSLLQPTPDNRPLVERLAFIRVPSLTTLVYLEKRPGIYFNQALVMGDPSGDLPYAAREVVQVAKHLGVRPLMGPAVTTKRLRQAAQARILHLATHAGLGPQGGWFGLADDRVNAADVIAWGLGPRLVVLASCASTARRGNGSWGSLSAAFLAAGSRNVLASLWSIQDREAHEFFSRFYALDGLNFPAKALNRVQRKMLAQGKSAFEWAAFVVSGLALPNRLVNREELFAKGLEQ